MLGKSVKVMDPYFQGKCYHECRKYVEPSLWENLTQRMMNKWTTYSHRDLSDAVTLRTVLITNN